jgi:hypothetical protein
MLRSTQRLLKQVQTANAAQLQQLRFLNVHEYQVGSWIGQTISQARNMCLMQVECGNRACRVRV